MSCETISVRKVDYYVNNPFACILDIRDEQDYKQAHIKGAINIPYDIMIKCIEGNINNVIHCNILEDKSKTYVIYCDRGAMSMIICNKLSRRGYITKTVVGGFTKYNGRYRV